MEKQRLHRLAAILKEAAAGIEHERIRGDLDHWAQARGFPHRLNGSLSNGGKPDVLRANAAKDCLFIGDAKDSEHETTTNLATYARISSYMAEFADLIGEGDIRGGYFAVATDREDEARSWASHLNVMAILRGLTTTAGENPSFQVDQIAERTWVAWW